MGIYVDSLERTGIKKLPLIQNNILVPGLEAMTGADLMVSPISMPATTPQLIQLHLKQGAQLVQVKIGWDLATSIGDRLKESQCRMAEIGARPVQRALLFVGVITFDNEANALIDGKPSPVQNQPTRYTSVQTALDSWNDRGGVTFQLYHTRMIEQWVVRRQQRLKQYAQEPMHTFYPTVQAWEDAPADDDPYQIVVKASWERRILATLVGPQLADAILARTGTLGFALTYITDMRTPHQKDRPKGWGPGVQGKAMKRLGLKPGQVITITEP